MDRLLQLYGPWGEHPDHPVDGWKAEVANDNIRLGYWAWVASRADDAQNQVTPRPN
ncbi:hypothetical protein [Novosphingobium sp. NBM11]|uniref:hypothetical protein n=1 Tax=Novosphingobium sp. NBM11 TaxID=2596914 RepID=UPI001891F404|nr:hypothetical protein [Novosphingobium sp. NBM11]